MTPYVYGARSTVLPRVELNLEEFIFETVSGALDDWGVRMEDVDGVVTASSDGLDGRAISMMVTGASVGAYARDTINLSSSSEHALFYMSCRVLAGRTKLGLVASWGKTSETSLTEITRISADPFFGRNVEYGRQAALDLETEGFLAAHALAPAVLDSLAPHYAGELTGADSCTVMLVGPDAAWKRPDGSPPLRVRGMGVAIGSYWPDEAAIGRWPALGAATASALSQAGLERLDGQVDAYEIVTLSSAQEAMAAIELGLAEPGALAGYAQRRGHDLAINTSGGLRGAYPDFGAGLLSVERACTALWARPGAGPHRGLAHGSSGFPPQGHSVFIMEREQ